METKVTKMTRQKTATITFPEPLQFDGETVHALTMRRATVKDQLEAQKSSDNVAEQELHLFARLCGINPELVETMDIADYRLLQEQYSSFLRR